MPLTNPLAWMDRLDAITTNLCECLEENTELGAPTLADGSFNCYKIHSDEWPGDCCDSLILKVLSVNPTDPTIGFPATAGPTARNARGCTLSLQVNFAVRLFRPCGVMAKGGNIRPVLPSGVSLDDEADSALLDLNAMLCCLACGIDFGPTDMTTKVYIGGAVPFKSGDCYGWQINGSVTLPNCSFTP